jgi:hypothetical protein
MKERELMADKYGRLADIAVKDDRNGTRVSVTVPSGTTLAEALKLHEVLSSDVLSKVSPRGCQPCLSGVDLNIRERWEEIIQVDLESMRVVGH